MLNRISGFSQILFNVLNLFPNNFAVSRAFKIVFKSVYGNTETQNFQN